MSTQHAPEDQARLPKLRPGPALSGGSLRIPGVTRRIHNKVRIRAKRSSAVAGAGRPLEENVYGQGRHLSWSLLEYGMPTPDGDNNTAMSRLRGPASCLAG